MNEVLYYSTPGTVQLREFRKGSDLTLMETGKWHNVDLRMTGWQPAGMASAGSSKPSQGTVGLFPRKRGIVLAHSRQTCI